MGKSPDWFFIISALLIAILGIFSSHLVITGQYFPHWRSSEYERVLIWINWANRLRGKPQQTRITPRQKLFVGYGGMVAGFLLIGIAVWLYLSP